MLRSVPVGCVVLVLGAACSPGPSNTVDGDIAFTHVNVISMKSDQVATGQTVVISDGRITHVAPTVSLDLDDSVETIDGAGRYLMPGLADMHDHVTGPESLKLNVAYGVTTVRNLWGDENTLKWREAVRRGEIIGPEIITASPLIDDDPPSIPGSALLTRPEDADALVKRFKDAGYDFLKPYRLLKEDVYIAMMAAAHKYNMPVEGHMPEAIDVAQAIELGQHAIEHATGFSAAIVNDAYPWSPAFRSREAVETVGRVNAGDISYADVFDRHKLRRLSRLAAEKGTAVSVTMQAVGLRALSAADREALKSHLQIRFLEPEYRAFWFAEDFDAMVNKGDQYTPEEIESLESFVTTEFGAWIGIMAEEGVLLLGGTDAPNPGLFHGYSLHDELQNLVTFANLTPYRALQTVTSNTARFWALEGKRGVVAAGADADLLLLEANPLTDIANTRSIQGVMINGKWLDRNDLDDMLLAVEQAYAEAASQ